jgi:hypothetical protein
VFVVGSSVSSSRTELQCVAILHGAIHLHSMKPLGFRYQQITNTGMFDNGFVVLLSSTYSGTCWCSVRYLSCVFWGLIGVQECHPLWCCLKQACRFAFKLLLVCGCFACRAFQCTPVPVQPLAIEEPTGLGMCCTGIHPHRCTMHTCKCMSLSVQKPTWSYERVDWRIGACGTPWEGSKRSTR